MTQQTLAKDKGKAQEIKSPVQATLNSVVCDALASDFTLDEINLEDIYVEDDEDKSFEEALRRENLLF